VSEVNTAQIIIASLIISALLIITFGQLISSLFGPTSPEPLIDASASLTLDCKTGTFYGNGYYTTFIQSAATYLDLSVKSLTSQDITIDKIAPIVENMTDYTAYISLSIPPHQKTSWYGQVNWTNIKGGSIQAYPGDTLSLTSGGLERVSSGYIFSYSGNLPSTQPTGYNCPFIGNNLYKPTVSGTIINATIDQPGCAPILLQSNVLTSKTLVLASIIPLDYFYSDYDIPFYLHIYGSSTDTWGVYWRGGPTGRLGLINIFKNNPTNPTEVRPSSSNPAYFAYWIDSVTKRIELYTDNSPSPSLTSSGAISSISLSNYVIGIARTRPATPIAPPIIFYNYMFSSTPQYMTGIDLSNNVYTVAKITASGYDIVITGTFPILPEGSDVETYLRNYGVVAIRNSNPNVDRFIDVYANGEYRLHRFYAPAMPGASIDLIIAWEDLVGPYPPGSPNIDGNGDEWLRVTYFNNGTWRVGVYVASGGYRHAFYIGDTLVYDKPYSTTWSNSVCYNVVLPPNPIILGYSPSLLYIPIEPSNPIPTEPYCEYYEISEGGLPRYVYYPWMVSPISSSVNYIGVFKDRSITINGLYPGDKVILSTPTGRSIQVDADGTTVTIDLLSNFGAYDLISAVLNGGISVSVQPSPSRIFTILPNKAYVHVVSKTSDTWVEIPITLAVSSSCSLKFGSTNSVNQLIIERMNDTYKLTLYTPDFPNGLSLGIYPKVIVSDMRGFTMTIYYTDGSSITYSDKYMSTNFLPSGTGIALVDDTVKFMRGYTYIGSDTKSFTRISITGIMKINAFFTK